jgi:hypothetical protein
MDNNALRTGIVRNLNQNISNESIDLTMVDELESEQDEAMINTLSQVMVMKRNYNFIDLKKNLPQVNN